MRSAKLLYGGGYGISFVQFDLLTNLSDPFPKKIVRERLTGSSAFYGERVRDIVWGNGGREERSLLKKLRKTFIWGWGMGGVCASPFASQCERSVPYVDRSRAADEGHPPSTGSECGI